MWCVCCLLCFLFSPSLDANSVDQHVKYSVQVKWVLPFPYNFHDFLNIILLKFHTWCSMPMMSVWKSWINITDLSHGIHLFGRLVPCYEPCCESSFLLCEANYSTLALLLTIYTLFQCLLCEETLEVTALCLVDKKNTYFLEVICSWSFLLWGSHFYHIQEKMLWIAWDCGMSE